MNPLLNFYNRGRMPTGETLKEVLAWDDQTWEKRHDFIQWVFPTKTPSRYNKNAPILDDETIANWHIELDQNGGILLQASFIRFWRFLRLHKINEKPFWVEPGNHNLLRITRVLECMDLLDMTGLAETLRTKLKCLAYEYPDDLREALPYWNLQISVG